VKLVVHLDKAKTATIVAAGTTGRRKIVIAREDGTDKNVVLTPEQYLSSEEYANVYGAADRDEKESEDDKKTRLSQQRQKIADKWHRKGGVVPGGLDGLIDAKDYKEWLTSGDYSEETKAKLHREIGEKDEIETAVDTLRTRDHLMMKSAQNADKEIKKYGESVAGKAKLFAQLEYKGQGLPLEATEKAILNEKIRNEPFDEMTKRSESHQKVNADFEQWTKDLEDNSPGMQAALDEAWDKHRGGMVASGRWLANGHDGKKGEQAIFQGLDMVVGEDVQIQSVKGEPSKDVGFIGKLNCGKTVGQSCRNAAIGTVEFQTHETSPAESVEVFLTDLAKPGAVKVADMEEDADLGEALGNYQRLKEHLETQLDSAIAKKERMGIQSQIDKVDGSVKHITTLMNEEEQVKKDETKAAADAPANEAPEVDEFDEKTSDEDEAETPDHRQMRLAKARATRDVVDQGRILSPGDA